MNKMVGATEFKAKCLRLIEQMQADGEPITITKRGKPVATLKPIRAKQAKPLFGLMKSDKYRFDADPSAPAADPSEWDALR